MTLKNEQSPHKSTVHMASLDHAAQLLDLLACQKPALLGHTVFTRAPGGTWQALTMLDTEVVFGGVLTAYGWFSAC